MRIRLAAMLTAAMFLLPAATAAAGLSSSTAQPEKKCPSSMSFILDHCE